MSIPETKHPFDEIIESEEYDQVARDIAMKMMPFTWRDDAALSSAGSIADVGSHAYDTVRWILGDNAKRV